MQKKFPALKKPQEVPEKDLADLVASLSLEEKIGQILMSAFFDYSDANLANIQKTLAKYPLGGIFHFSCDPQTLAKNLASLQKQSKVPLLVAADFEIGPGWLVPGGIKIPRPMARGQQNNPENEYKLGALIAEQARALGTNVNFSPVVDLNTNPLNPDVNIRAYSDSKDPVISCAVPHVKGLQEQGMAACVKHFPGNGSTDLDQHINAALISQDAETIRSTSLEVYRQVFRQSEPACVMVAHLEVPALVKEENPRTGRPVPASVSKEILQDILRKDLGFEGLAISDAMNMGGVLIQYTREEAALKAIQAGMDMLLLFSPDSIGIEFDALLKAVKEGSLSTERLDEAVGRVLRTKIRLGLLHPESLEQSRNPDIDLIKSLFQEGLYDSISESILQKGLCLLRNQDQVLPLKSISGKKVLVLSSHNPDRETLENQGQASAMVEDHTPELLKKRGAQVEAYELPLHLDGAKAWQIMENAKEADLIFLNFFIIPTWAIGSLIPNKSTLRLFMNGLPMLKAPLIITAFGDPFVIRQFPTVPSYLCTFDESQAAQEAAVKAWLGEIPLTGKSPVSLAGIFNRGDGLETTQINPSLS